MALFKSREWNEGFKQGVQDRIAPTNVSNENPYPYLSRQWDDWADGCIAGIAKNLRGKI